MRAWSLIPGALSTPDDTSTISGAIARTACDTFSGLSPPASTIRARPRCWSSVLATAVQSNVHQHVHSHHDIHSTLGVSRMNNPHLLGQHPGHFAIQWILLTDIYNAIGPVQNPE